MKERIILLTKSLCTLLIGGIAYYFIYTLTGLGLLCPLNFLTGYLCPCCGVSRMLVSLIKFDFASAFYYNAGLLIFLPILLFLIVSHFYDYIKTGNQQLRKWKKIILFVIIGIMLVFGVLRNVMDLGLMPTETSVLNKFFGG